MWSSQLDYKPLCSKDALCLLVSPGSDNCPTSDKCSINVDDSDDDVGDGDDDGGGNDYRGRSMCSLL